MLLKRLAALGTRGTGPAAQRWEGLVFSGALLLQELLIYPRLKSVNILKLSTQTKIERGQGWRFLAFLADSAHPLSSDLFAYIPEH